jgi:hypothetical protein
MPRPPIKIKKPGDLHRRLGVPVGQKIPEAKKRAAMHSSDPVTAKEARYAVNVLAKGNRKGK